MTNIESILKTCKNLGTSLVFAASIYSAGCATSLKAQQTYSPEPINFKKTVLTSPKDLEQYDPSPEALTELCTVYRVGGFSGRILFVYASPKNVVAVMGWCKHGKPHGTHEFMRKTPIGYEGCSERYQDGHRVSDLECKPLK